MSVQASDLVSYLSANRPEDDSSTSGGARDAAARELDQQLTADDTIDVVSDGADTRDVTIKGRDPNGNVVTETLTLNGTTTVSGSQTFERILNISLSASDANRTVTVSDGDSGDGTLHTFNPDETDAAIMFQQAQSEGSETTRYEKVFIRNETGDGTALQAAALQITADPTSNIRVAPAATKDDSVSVSNRETRPQDADIVGTSFVDDNTQVSVPGSSLGDGEAIGVWVELTLAAGETANRSSWTLEISGTTT